MGISRTHIVDTRAYATNIANDLMRAYREGLRKGRLTHGAVGFSCGLVLGTTFTIWALNRYNIETAKAEVKTE